MNVHLHREVEELKKKILAYSADVESSVEQAVKALKDRDIDLARHVIERDSQLDLIEVEIEEVCLRILALHTPVANDLRFIVVVLKINNDLERIADMAVNIAQRALSISDWEAHIIPRELNIMLDRAQTMLNMSLEALIDLDVDKAQQVIGQDDEVDRLNKTMYTIIESLMMQKPDEISYLINLLSTSRNLERIADLVTNIAEDVIYLVSGKIIRHKNRQV